MDENKKQELEELLTESLGRLTIESPYIKKVTPQVYKSLFFSRKNQRFLKQSCSFDIKDDNIKSSLFKFLWTELADYMDNGRMLTYIQPNLHHRYG